MSLHDESADSNSTDPHIDTVQPHAPAAPAANAERARSGGIKGVTRSMLEMIADRAPKKPERVSPAAPPLLRSDVGDVSARARQYLATMDPSVSGQHGHDRLMSAARAVRYGFDVPHAEAYALLVEWNRSCSPPWDERDLERKLTEVDRTPDPRGLPRGHLRDTDSRGQAGQPHAPPTAATKSGPLRNYTWDEVKDGETMRRVKRGRSIREIAGDLLHRASGWPKRCGPRLFAIDRRGEPEYLRRVPDLFAWMHRVLDVGAGSPLDWAGGTDLLTKEEYAAGLIDHVERYDAVEMYHHEPPLAGHYYACPSLPPSDGTALAGLLRLFCPHTPGDEDLIRALLMTLVWGGPPGARPAWLVSTPGDGRGAGKTKLAQKVADVVGGSLMIKTTHDLDRWTDSYISGRFGGPTAGQRVVLIDNIKSLRLSDADLESMVTGQTISGHLMYHGAAQVPNTLTMILTGNRPSLSRDMAQRVIPIMIDPAEYSPTWEQDIDDYIRLHRWGIISDLVADLKRPANPMSQYLRWSAWCGAVLSRAPEPDVLVRMIRERQSGVDADTDLAEQVREAIVAAVANARPAVDPEATAVRLTSDQMFSIAGDVLDVRTARATSDRLMHVVSVRGLRHCRTKSFRGWVWSGELCGKDVEPWTIDGLAE